MAKEYAKGFYNSKAWQDCREAYLRKVSYLCEECLKEGIITKASDVHHIEYITRENIHNPSITLNHNNLMALCKDHHNKVHQTKSKRYQLDELGRVIL